AAFVIEQMAFHVPFRAVGIRRLQITGADLDPSRPSPQVLFAEVEIDIYKGARLSGTGEALAIDLQTFEADISIREIIVGQQSIGSVFMDDLAVSSTSMRIYGH